MKRLPSYLKLFEQKELDHRINELEQAYGNCRLCPHNCGIDRFLSSNGVCKSGTQPLIASYGAHFGEEPPISGTRGSGTIFFGNCNLKCIFCQNCDISQEGNFRVYTYDDLAGIMISLQEMGCHNINFVSPTHMILPIVKSLKIAISMGLSIPLVYNSGGYDSVKTLKLLNGVFDIYMPDLKYADDEAALRLSGVSDYFDVAKKAIRLMYNQAGTLKMDSCGIAYRGLLVRHLLLPGEVASAKRIMDFILSLSADVHVNLMTQYYPAYNSFSEPSINRRLSEKEWVTCVKYAKGLGINLLE